MYPKEKDWGLKDKIEDNCGNQIALPSNSAEVAFMGSGGEGDFEEVEGRMNCVKETQPADKIARFLKFLNSSKRMLPCHSCYLEFLF